VACSPSAGELPGPLGAGMQASSACTCCAGGSGLREACRRSRRTRWYYCAARRAEVRVHPDAMASVVVADHAVLQQHCAPGISMARERNALAGVVQAAEVHVLRRGAAGAVAQLAGPGLAVAQLAAVTTARPQPARALSCQRCMAGGVVTVLSCMYHALCLSCCAMVVLQLVATSPCTHPRTMSLHNLRFLLRQ
jgi:hypothetical protein